MARSKRSTKELSERDAGESKRSTKELSYGKASSRLEEILEKIEEGKVDIDELSGLVAEAAELVTLCRKKIQAAEVQVTTITEKLEREATATAYGEGDDE